jgi:alkyl hydroperoxide reductase subunit D
MQAYANHGGVGRRLFELYALAASIVGKCHFCVRSHYALLKESGMSVDQLRDVGRIAAVIAAAANAIAVNEPAFA